MEGIVSGIDPQRAEGHWTPLLGGVSKAGRGSGRHRVSVRTRHYTV